MFERAQRSRTRVTAYPKSWFEGARFPLGVWTPVRFVEARFRPCGIVARTPDALACGYRENPWYDGLGMRNDFDANHESKQHSSTHRRTSAKRKEDVFWRTVQGNSGLAPGKS